MLDGCMRSTESAHGQSTLELPDFLSMSDGVRERGLESCCLLGTPNLVIHTESGRLDSELINAEGYTYDHSSGARGDLD